MAIEFLDEAPNGGVEFLDKELTPAQQAAQNQKLKEAPFKRIGVAPQGGVTDPLAALIYGALQQAGQIPGDILSAGIQGIQKYGQLAEASSGMGGIGEQYAVNQKALESINPVRDLTPKIFEAAGVPTNFPTSPQFEYPNTAAIGENLPFLAPAKALASLARETKALDFARNFRAAIKPSNAQVGARVEKAAENQTANIFHINPNADKEATSPFEGFAQSVSAAKKQVQNKLDQVRSRIGGKLNAGDEIATELENEAALLRKRGEPAASVQALLERANDFKGQATNLEDLQGSVTLANQKQTPFFQKSLVAQSPALANAENIANRIISKKGGEILNKEMETVGGPEAAELRRQWSELNTLEQQSLERINKLINKAEPEIQSAAASALTSTKGVLGLFGLINGHPSAALGVAGAVLEKFQRNAARELNSSNAIISRTYDALRKSPPPVPQAFVLPPAPAPIPTVPLGGFPPPTASRTPSLPVSTGPSLGSVLSEIGSPVPVRPAPPTGAGAAIEFSNANQSALMQAVQAAREANNRAVAAGVSVSQVPPIPYTGANLGTVLYDIGSPVPVRPAPPTGAGAAIEFSNANQSALMQAVQAAREANNRAVAAGVVTPRVPPIPYTGANLGTVLSDIGSPVPINPGISTDLNALIEQAIKNKAIEQELARQQQLKNATLSYF